MSNNTDIPSFALFGETEQFPDVIHCERFSARAPVHGWHIQAHRHAQMAQLFLVRSGRIDAVVDGQKLIITAQNFLFVPANNVHQFDFQPETEGLVASFLLNVMNTVGPASQDVNAALSLPLTGKTSKMLEDLSELLAKSASSDGPFRIQQSVGLAHSALAIVAGYARDSGGASHSPTSDRLARFDQLIGAHMRNGWGAADYAAALAISTGHLSRLCRHATGQGAAAYIDRTIMGEACRMLAFTQLPVSEIGYRLGYSDPSYFSKRFRASQKLSPSAYRAQFAS